MVDRKRQPKASLNDGRDEPPSLDIEKQQRKHDVESKPSSQDGSQVADINAVDKISPTTENQAVPINDLHKVPTEKDYSSFTNWEKKFIVFSATMGAFFSPFTTQIYFPAITSIAKDLRVSNSKINLTMTTYMILQAIAPAFIGNLSDTAGRRPGYIVSFIIYIIADIALALQNNYVALLVLRMVQSAGSSGTVALANAVIADIATSAERGIYIGITSSATILAPSLGPILGGILSQYAGWKWIFWFLAILAGCFFIPMLLFMPETCRKIVGDGSIPPPTWNRSLMNHIDEKRRLETGLGPPDYAERDVLKKKRGKLRFPNPFDTLVIAFEKECFIILFFASIVYAGFYAVMSGMPSQLKDIYGYDDLKVGLMYLPIAGGSIVAAFTQGRFIDWNYARHAKKLGIVVQKRKMQDISNFPIERARLEVAIPFLFLSCVSTIVYGWIMHFRVSVAGPAIMLFLQGYGLIASTQCISIIIVDINPGLAGTATAAFNLIRCLLGAGATALIVPMTDAMGLGWAYTFIGLLYVVLSPMLWVVIRLGPKWRKEKNVREEAKEEEKKERK